MYRIPLKHSSNWENWLSGGWNVTVADLTMVSVYRSSPAGGRLMIWRGSYNPVRF